MDQLSVLVSAIESEINTKTILLLNGSLGAGKTFFVKELVRSLGGAEATSPTYSLINSYPLLDRGELFHVDLYRLDNQEDLESTGFWDLFSRESGFICVEWASRLNPQDLPLDWKQITLEISKTDEATVRLYELQVEDNL